MTARVSLMERIIDRLATDEARKAVEIAGADEKTKLSKNVTMMKAWLYSNLEQQIVKDAIIKVVKDSCG